jgi:hypothetical protein
VAVDGSEISTPEGVGVDPAARIHQRLSDPPRPSGDTVALPFARRFVHLGTGWHNSGINGQQQVTDNVTEFLRRCF